MNKHSLVCAWAFTGIFYSSGANFSKATIIKDPFTTFSPQVLKTQSLFSFKNQQQK